MSTSSLMIDARKPCRLRIDGPALSVRIGYNSPLLFPLRRLARIHVIGCVSEGFDALIYCAERQIPVAFFTAKGKLRCQLYEPRYEDNILAHWLEHVEFDPACKEQYDDWLEAQRLHLLAAFGYRFGAREQRHIVIEQLLRTKANLILQRKKYSHEAIDWLEGLLSAHLSQLVSLHSMGRSCRTSKKLLADLLPIFTIAMLHVFVERMEQDGRIPTSSAAMSDFYHRYSSEVEYHLRRMLTQLANRIEGVV